MASRGDQIVPTSVWSKRKFRHAFSNPLRVDKFIMGATGSNTTLLSCFEFRTGKRVWVDRTLYPRNRKTIMAIDLG